LQQIATIPTVAFGSSFAAIAPLIGALFVRQLTIVWAALAT
jgi:hypothetical protein